MGAFQYVALDADGRELKGLIEGDTSRHARQLLRDRGLMPIELDEVRQRAEKRASSIQLRRGISGLDLAIMTRQLATLVKAGLPLDEALQAVSQQTEKARLKSIMLGVRARVLEGHALAAGLEDFPQAFPPVYRATIAAGEQAGQLDAVLGRLADYTESRHSMSQKISQAMIYPIVLSTLSFGIVVFMLVYIVPKIVGVFETTGQELPILTRGLIALSGFIQGWWWALLLGFAIAVFATARTLAQEGPKRNFHRSLLGLPVIGRVIRGINTARFTRTMAILSASGVPIVDGLRISAAVVNNLPMRDAINDASILVREGAAVSRALSQSKLFPPMTMHLIASGEASGELDNMLDSAASHQESEMDSLLGAMLSLLEPALIILMGGMVLLIVLAILLPIFQISQNV